MGYRREIIGIALKTGFGNGDWEREKEGKEQGMGSSYW